MIEAASPHPQMSMAARREREAVKHANLVKARDELRSELAFRSADSLDVLRTQNDLLIEEIRVLRGKLTEREA